MTYTFIRKAELIEENYQVDDLLDFSTIINKFKTRIDNINRNSIVGLKGAYGSGKSTMLYQIYKEQININKSKTPGNTPSQQTEQWFIFDAWQYPERKDLWEGFVLDIARQCDEKIFKKTENKVDGNSWTKMKIFVNMLIPIAATSFSYIDINILSSVKYLTHFFNTSPIKRVYEFQNLLLGILNKIDKHIFIVIEDIDRSGDMGVFFLETLKYFIKNLKEDPDRKVIVIVPIGEEIWQEGGDKKIQDSYSKILDFQWTFKPEYINFTKFIKKIFDINNISKTMNSSINSKLIGQPKPTTPDIIISHLRYLFENMILKEQQGAIRDIKSILRKSESNLSDIQEIDKQQVDIRILILFTAIEYFYQKEKNYKYTFPSSKGLGIPIDSDKDNFWGEELFFYIITGTNAMHKSISQKLTHDPYFIHTIDQGAWLAHEHQAKGNTLCIINSAYFSATEVKDIKP